MKYNIYLHWTVTILGSSCYVDSYVMVVMMRTDWVKSSVTAWVAYCVIESCTARKLVKRMHQVSCKKMCLLILFCVYWAFRTCYYLTENSFMTFNIRFGEDFIAVINNFYSQLLVNKYNIYNKWRKTATFIFFNLKISHKFSLKLDGEINMPSKIFNSHFKTFRKDFLSELSYYLYISSFSKLYFFKWYTSTMFFNTKKLTEIGM
jgi:hypothetical protein